MLAAAVAFSLLSAASFGLAAVCQHRAAVRESPEFSMKAGLLVRLARRPIWLVGNVLDWVGYLFQFLALARGSLTLVEPLLVISLPFGLSVSSWFERAKVRPSQMGAAVLTVGGLALLLVTARPGAGATHASAAAWAVLSATVAAGVTILAFTARRGSTRRAALLLAAGAGIAFGYVAAVTRVTTRLLDHGVIHLLSTAAPYALIVSGALALLLTQSAFQAGALRLSLPMITISEPLVATAIGVVFFGEHIRTDGLAPVWEVLGFALMTVGGFALASSPVLHDYKPANRIEGSSW